MRNVLVSVVTLCVMLACSRPSTLGPSEVGDMPQVPGTLTVRQARLTNVPVENASVTVVDGKMYLTDEHGQVKLPAEYNGRVIEVMAHGFILPRRVHYTPGMVVHLLPDDEQMSGEWLHTAFYQNDDSHLNRPRPGLISIELSDELLNNALFIASAQKAIEYINRTQGEVDFFIAETGDVKMELVPDDPIFSEPDFDNAWAVITGEFSDGYIVRSRVVWRFITRPEHHNLDSVTLWQAIAHELGHHVGIWGHPPGGIMNKSPIVGLQDYSLREKEALRYLFLRAVGTRKPDDSTWSPSVPLYQRAQQSALRTTRTVACGALH